MGSSFSMSSTPRITKPPEVSNGKIESQTKQAIKPVFEYRSSPIDAQIVVQKKLADAASPPPPPPAQQVEIPEIELEKLKTSEDDLSEHNSSQPIEMEDIIIDDNSSRVREELGDDDSLGRMEPPEFAPPSAYFSALSGDS